MSDSPLLQIDHITFCYPGDTKPAISELSVTIQAGESVVLLGANGSGKSTFLKILAGLIFPTSGTYSALNRKITSELLRFDPFGIYFRKELGIVFQNPDAQLFNPTVHEEIAFGPVQLNEPPEAIQTRVREILELFDISGLASRPPFALSGGEKKKVALASVLVTDPRIILLDEPTASLDPRSSRELLKNLVQLRNDGKTLVTATHDLTLAKELATRVIVFNEDKQIHADGKSNEILCNTELLRSANLL